MNTLELYRRGTLLHTIKIDNNSQQSKQILGENRVTLAFRTNQYLDLAINDYCTVFGEKYIVSEHPQVNKLGDNFFEYGVILDSEAAELSKALYLFLGTDNSLRLPDFSITGTATDFLTVVINNINRIDTGWTIGEVAAAGIKTISFKNTNCYNALLDIATAFETEFYISGKVIHLAKKETDTPLRFQQGQHRGLYNLSRTNINSTAVITRLYAYGSQTNLPPTYSGDRLHLPNGYNPCLVSNVTVVVSDNGDGTSNFSFTWNAPTSPDVSSISISADNPYIPNVVYPDFPVGGPAVLTLATDLGPGANWTFRIISHGGACVNNMTPPFGAPTAAALFIPTSTPYVEKNVPVFGIIEASMDFEEIKPQRTGVVTSIDITNPFVIVDSGLDFDINDQLLGGATAKITFNTGQLAGKTFNISNYNAGTKTITFLKNNEERAIDIPNNDIKAVIGDEYVLTDIRMPQSYVTEAENLLLEKALEAIDVYGEPQVSYQLQVDPLFLKQKGYSPQLGDLVRVVDADFAIDRKIRVTGLSRKLVNEYEYDIQLSDTLSGSTITRIVQNLQGVGRVVANVQSQLQNRDILNGRVVGTLEFSQMPETSTEAGFFHVLVGTDGKLYKKV